MLSVFMVLQLQLPIKKTKEKKYMLVMEYADKQWYSPKIFERKFLKNLAWNDKLNLAFQLVCAVSCLGSCIVIWYSGLSETPTHDTPEEYIKIYTNCWNIEPDNRPTINQVVDELKAIIIKGNIVIKVFHIYNDNNNIKSSKNHKLPNLNVRISESTNSLHKELSQIIQNFNMMNTKEIESSM
ncbi:uncharacterized protein OCT59_019236 [Rhizophagus irregularis]|uniref:uncharacterized protein n=1 Tax=Rhizophagus irregularis TaxID=588596 RepID=UPI003325E1D9|nr:hypothetical protein OCT59_019236 [Rhizophagus irregularis]